MACDLCGKRGCDLVELLPVHKTPAVQHVCDACRKDLDDEKRRLQESASTMVVDHLRSFIKRRAAANGVHAPPAQPGTMARFLRVFGIGGRAA